MAFAGAGSADEDGVALLGKEVAGCQLANERLVDGRAVEAEVVDILGQRQFDDGQLVFDDRRGTGIYPKYRLEISSKLCFSLIDTTNPPGTNPSCKETSVLLVVSVSCFVANHASSTPLIYLQPSPIPTRDPPEVGSVQMHILVRCFHLFMSQHVLQLIDF
jgi:hypothetical protein